MRYLCDKGTSAEWSRWLAYHFDLVGVTGSSPVSATNFKTYTIMEILTLIIKQKFFDEILSGKKKQEFREIRPNTQKKYCQLDAEGHPVLHEAERPAGTGEILAKGQFRCRIQFGLYAMAGEKLPTGFTENLQSVSDG